MRVLASASIKVVTHLDNIREGDGMSKSPTRDHGQASLLDTCPEGHATVHVHTNNTTYCSTCELTYRDGEVLNKTEASDSSFRAHFEHYEETDIERDGPFTSRRHQKSGERVTLVECPVCYCPLAPTDHPAQHIAEFHADPTLFGLSEINTPTEDRTIVEVAEDNDRADSLAGVELADGQESLSEYV